jgi:hypothetical protein
LTAEFPLQRLNKGLSDHTGTGLFRRAARENDLDIWTLHCGSNGRGSERNG